jgi:hypothetical protein
MLVLLMWVGMSSLLMAEVTDHLIHGVSIRCDGKFVPAQSFKRNEDAPDNQPVRLMESQICMLKGMEITIARTEYLEGAKMDLKELVKSSAAAMGRRAGITRPMQSTAAVTVSSLPAMRLSFGARLNEKPISVESLYFLKGQTIWTIQVLFAADEELRKKAEQILATVRYMP